MKCRDCKFLSEPKTFGDRYPSIRCTLGLWDRKDGTRQWYSYGNCQLNRGPVRELGEDCFRGEPKLRDPAIPKHTELDADEVRKLWQSGEGMMKNPIKKAEGDMAL